MKQYLVIDRAHFGTMAVRSANSPRQAAIDYIVHSVGCEKPRLQKMYAGGRDGKTYHVGYVYKEMWLEIAEFLPLHKEA